MGDGMTQSQEPLLALKRQTLCGPLSAGSGGSLRFDPDR